MNITGLIKKTTDLPTLPEVAIQLNQEWKKNSLTAKSLGKLISRDPSLSSKVLRLTNSAYYGLPGRVDTLDRAVTIIGFNAIISLALTASVFRVFESSTAKSIKLKGLWLHSLGCAICAKTIAAFANHPKLISEKAFLAGIIHDIGHIVIAHAMPEALQEVKALMKDSDINLIDAENEVMGFNHQEAGGKLAEEWNFPVEYCTVIYHHHDPSPKIPKDDSTIIALHQAVGMGNLLAKELNLGTSIDQNIGHPDNSACQQLDISTEIQGKLIAAIKNDYRNMTELLGPH